MAKLLLGPNGRLLIAGGRAITAVPASISNPTTTSLAVKDIYVGNSIAHAVIQRKAGTDYGDVPVMFTYTGGAPSSIQARVVNTFTPTTIIKDWTALSSVTVNDSTLTGIGYLTNVPIGCDYQLQLRDGSQPANSATTSVGTRRWGVGVVILVAGQSNMLGTLDGNNFDQAIPGTTKNESSYWNDPEFTGVYWGLDGFVVNYTAGGSGSGYVMPGWDSGAGGGTGFLRMVASNLKAKYGRKIPVCGALWAFGATGLGDMFPPGGKSSIYTNSGTTGGTIGWLSPPGYTPGDFEGIVLHQGEAESGGISRADRLNQLKAYYTFMLGLVAPHGRTAADLFFRPAVLGSYTNGGLSRVENVRAAVYDLEAYAQANGWPRVKAGWNCIDLDAGDPLDPDTEGLHFHNISGGNQYKAWSLRRVVQDVAEEMGAATFGGQGPKIAGVSRSGNTVTVTVTHDGGTALAVRKSGSALTGWYANTAADFSGTDIAVIAVIASPNTITVTFPSGSTFPAYLKYAGGKVGTMQSQHPNVSNPVYDNVAYPTNVNPGDQYTGLPLQPTVDSWRID